MTHIRALAFLLAFACFLTFQSQSKIVLASAGDPKTTNMGVSFDVSSYGNDFAKIDRNGDGKIDYVVKAEKSGAKVFEAMDFNNDGLLDDFYIYEKGTLVRREVDTNFDGKIDLWIYIYNGQYVQAYERDVNFDGTIDLVKDFDRSTASAKP